MRVELLTVTDVFDLTDQGLVCAPFLQPSSQGTFRNFSAVVQIQPPDGAAFDANASFRLVHFNILDVTAPAGKRWQIVTGLGKIPKDAVPIGSVIFCDSETRAVFSASA